MYLLALGFVEAKSNTSLFVFLTQRQFALDVTERTGMVDYKPVSMPVDT
jgi:hypothetical protein